MNEAERLSDDDRLIARVRAVSDSAIDPETVEERVGKRALVNTGRGDHLEMLRRVALAPEPDHLEEPPALETAQAVVYWARPIDATNPRVVGLQIGASGAATVFFAEVLPP